VSLSDHTALPPTREMGLRADLDAARSELARLRSIIDRPDPHDFMAASEIEARFQLDKWGTTEGFPTAFDNTDDAAFVYLIAYLTGKVAATPDHDLDKKLHRVTTIAAAAANWHAAILERVGCPHCEYGNVWITNDASVPCDRCGGTGKRRP
jgi:hypothetical protein